LVLADLPSLREAYSRPRVITPETPDDEAQEKLNLLILTYQTRFRQLAAQWSNDPDRLLVELQTELYYLHVAAAAIAVGGTSRLTGPDMTVIDRNFSTQQRHLLAFMSVIRPPSSFDQIAVENRASLYAGLAANTYSRVFAQALGLPPLPAYPGDGSTACLQWCKCHWRIFKLEGNGNFDVYWIKTAMESCPQCIQRAAVWSPLQVRNGVFVNLTSSGVFRA
jgi:hypothetical protein